MPDHPKNLPALLTEKLPLPSRGSVASDLLRLARNDHLSGRLDGLRPISSGIAASFRAEGRNAELVFLIPKSEAHPKIDLLRVVDFDNGHGYKLFEVTHHPSLNAQKAQELLYKMRQTFDAAIQIMEARINSRAQEAVADFLTAPMRTRAEDVADFAATPPTNSQEPNREKILSIADRSGIDIQLPRNLT